jgi:transposase
MNKDREIFGIDISKDVFDVYTSSGKSLQYENSPGGFRKFMMVLSRDAHCVMEATGYYHYRLAGYLTKQKIKVSVVNPLSVKRFIQMSLSRIKTDKSDAKMICLYGEQQAELKIWHLSEANQKESLQIVRLLDQYTKQSTALKNKIHGEEVLGKPSKIVLKSLRRSLRNLQKEQALLEEELMSIVEQDHRDMLVRLGTIPGLGKKTTILLLVLTEGFTKFETASQLCSFCGITPIIKQSGSSVRGRSRISKMGNRKLRNLLFLCSFTACRHNKACADIYQRIVNKGKSKKLALIAVSNKLVKQAFAIATSGLCYDENYRSRLPV